MPAAKRQTEYQLRQTAKALAIIGNSTEGTACAVDRKSRRAELTRRFVTSQAAKSLRQRNPQTAAEIASVSSSVVNSIALPFMLLAFEAFPTSAGISAEEMP